MADVMISLHVSTMKETALIIKEFLENAGLSVWVCVEMSAGVNYRDEIVHHVKTCQVFVPLLNQEWALSGECEDEYLLAKRLNLTSHESGRTKRPELRRPIMAPIAFSNLVWNQHPHVELLAAKTNFIVHGALNLVDCPIEKRQMTLNNLLLAFHTFGFNVKIPKELAPAVSNKGSSGGSSAGGASNDHVMSLQEQIIELHSSLQSITSSVQNLALSSSSSSGNQASEKKVAEKGQVKPVLGKEYLGTSEGNGELLGSKYAYWDSCHLTILSYDPQTNQVKGRIMLTELRKLCDGKASVEPDHPLAEWMSTTGNVEERTVEGTFDSTNNLVSLYDVTSTGDVSTMKKYFMVLLPDKMVGVGQMLVPREDLADPMDTNPLVLDQLS